MKNLMITLVVLGGLVFLGTNVAEAQQTEQKKAPEPQTTQTTPTTQPGFVDANGDGICDNYNGTQPGKGLGPGNGQGLGRANGRGLGYGQCWRNGAGPRQGMRNGTGPLRNGTGPYCNPPAK